MIVLDLNKDLFADRRFAIMGVINVTPDSFSDGGLFLDAYAAVEHGLAIADAGAEILDVGGESTRPGSLGVDVETEIARVIPVIEQLIFRRPELLISIDTSKVDVARAALKAGASMVNDVTAGASPGMFEIVAEFNAAITLMHMRGEPRTMQKSTAYGDVVGEVKDHLLERVKAAIVAGVSSSSILVDPGIGFGKNLEGNLALLRGLPRLAEAGHPIVLGTSRKSFLGLITDAPADERIGATLASLIPVLAVDQVIVRVHDVVEVARFRAVIEALGVGVCDLW